MKQLDTQHARTKRALRTARGRLDTLNEFGVLGRAVPAEPLRRAAALVGTLTVRLARIDAARVRALEARR